MLAKGWSVTGQAVGVQAVSGRGQDAGRQDWDTWTGCQDSQDDGTTWALTTDCTDQAGQDGGQDVDRMSGFTG